jgi:uncharacterized repeat protein (TIGR01451 family)
MKKVVLALFSLLLPALAGTAAGNCLTDTTQADFLAGVASSVDLTTNPGNVQLTSSGGGGGASIDQQNTTITNNGVAFTNASWVGQTFTAGKSGSLNRADVNLFCVFCLNAPPSIIVSIRATSGGMPTGSDLASASVAISDYTGTQAFYAANFPSAANVNAGTQYAIIIRASAAYGTSGKNLGFSDSAASAAVGDNVYAGGQLVRSTSGGSSWSAEPSYTPTADGGFKTYIGGSSGGYSSDGNLTSSLKDSAPPSGSTPTWSTLSWNSSVPANTAVKFQAAASNSTGGPFNFVGPDGSSASYFTSTNASIAQFNGNRYLKYRTFLSTSSSSSTPVLNDATACFSSTVPATSSDVSISVSDGATAEVPGTSVTYTITAANAGPDAVSRATVSDTFQAPLTSCHWTCAGGAGGTCSSAGSGNINDNTVTLPVGGTATYTAVCSLPTSVTGTLSNTATITDPTGVTDPSPNNNTSTDSEPLTPQVELSITNSDGQTSQTAGLSATYNIQVTNTGPSDAPGTMVVDTFPSALSCTWTCTGTFNGTCPAQGAGHINTSVNLPKGGHTNFTATCSIASSATGTLTNTATVTAANGVTDTNTSNNSATDSDSLVIRPDVAISMDDGVDMVRIGDVVNYVIRLTNAGPSDAAVSVSDTSPPQLSNPSWVCSATGGATCAKSSGNNALNTTATVPVGGVATYVYSMTVQSDDAGDSFVNTARSSVTNGSDPNGTNNTVSETNTIVVFLSGFEGHTTTPTNVVEGTGGGSITAQFGLDAGLLNTLGPAPVTVASGHSSEGRKLFSLQLMRLGGDVAMRTLTTIDNTVFSDVSPWQVVDLKQHVLGLQWQSATARGDDGYLRTGPATQNVLTAANNAQERLTQLQVSVENEIPWLVLIQQ